MTWIQDLKTNLQAQIYNITGVETIRANQNVPRPETDYITYLISSVVTVGMMEIEAPDENGDRFLKEIKEVTIALQCISLNASQILEDLIFNLKKEIEKNNTDAYGFGFYDFSNVNDVTVLLDDTTYEDRSAVDIFARTCVYITENAGYIDKVTGTGTITGSGAPISVPVSIDTTI